MTKKKVQLPKNLWKPTNSPFYSYKREYGGEPFNRSTKCTNIRDAVRRGEEMFAEWCAKKDAEIAAKGRATSPAKLQDRTLKEACALYYVQHAEELRSASDLKRRYEKLPTYFPADVRLVDLTNELVREAKERRRGTGTARSRKPGAKLHYPSKTTVNRDVVAPLRAVLNHAIEMWEMSDIPTLAWKKLWNKEPEPLHIHFTPEEIAAIIAELSECWHPLAHFLFDHGTRLGEAIFCPLACWELDGPNPQVVLRGEPIGDGKGGTKNGKTRMMPLVGEWPGRIAALKAEAKLGQLDTIWFRRFKNGKLQALSYEGAKGAFSDAMRDSGVFASKGARGAHAIRHHFANELLEATNDIDVVSVTLGHTGVAVTKRYARSNDARVRAALERKASNKSSKSENQSEEGSKNNALAG